MLLTPHLLVGAAIIANVQNPALGLILVFLSHYFLDAFPHKDYLIENIKISPFWGIASQIVTMAIAIYFLL